MSDPFAGFWEVAQAFSRGPFDYAERTPYRLHKLAEEWLAKQYDPRTATGPLGVIIAYLAMLRADIYRSQSTKPGQINWEDFILPFGKAHEAAESAEEREGDKVDLGGPQLLTKESIAAVHKAESRMRMYGKEKALEMERKERAGRCP